MRHIPLALCLLSSPGLAQQTARAGDTLFDPAALTALLANQELVFFTGGLAEYHADGRYTYRYAPQDTRVPGTYEVRAGSLVCTDFANGFDRCDLVVQSAGRIVFVIENGERYPIKSITPLTPP